VRQRTVHLAEREIIDVTIAGIVVSLRRPRGNCGRHRALSNRKETKMNWDRIEDNWKQIKGNVVEQWNDLTEDQLASRIQETYGISDDEAERELTDWQQRLSEINRAA
jgi:uncharacterized protein YjbJ (UPF0337 family)